MDSALLPQNDGDMQDVDATHFGVSQSPVPFHYQGEIPPFVSTEIERLYSNLYSSLPHLSIEGRLAGASTYVVRDQGRLTAVLLYQVVGNKLTVLNEVIDLSRTEIAQFSKYMFDALKNLDVIFFRAIHTDIRAVPFKVQRFNYLEDMTIRLPGSEDEYMAQLSPKNRSNLRRKFKSVKADYPSFEIRYLEKEDIQIEQILALVALNRARMSEKNKKSAYAEAESKRMVQLARRNGVMVLASIDGEICGGVVSYRMGDNYFSLMVAHDPKYNEHSLGLLCNYRAICEAISHGAKELHFLWGRYHYKFALQALPRELDVVVVYRSRISYFLNLPEVAKAYALQLRRRYSLWKHYQKQEKGIFFRWSKFMRN